MFRSSVKLAVATMSAGLILVLVSSHSRADGCRRRAFCEPALPRYEYQSGISPLRGSLASYPAQSGDVPGEPQTKKKSFQPLANELVVGDCKIADPRLLLDSNGRYVMSFRSINTASTAEPAQLAEELKAGAAPKDPKATKPAASTTTPVLPVRHHRMQVRVSLYGGAAAGTDKSRASGVLLTKLSCEVFYVNAGEERPLSFDGEGVTRRQFDEANQVEFELIVDPTVPTRDARKRPIVCPCR